MAAAYAVVLAAVLVYVAIIALKLARFEREVAELTELARERQLRLREREREEARVG